MRSTSTERRRLRRPESRREEPSCARVAGGRLGRALLVLVLVVPAACQAGSFTKAGGVRELTVTSAEAAAGVELPDVFVIAGSDSVFVIAGGDSALTTVRGRTASSGGGGHTTVGGGAEGEHRAGTVSRRWALVRGRDYTFDHRTGSIAVLTALPPGAAVRISYRCVPLDVPRLFRIAVPESLAELPPGFAEEAVLVRSAADSVAPPPRGLTVGGAKTFGITVGSNRDASLEQSLRLNISGRITRDVTVNAFLSDQNTPLVPEGDTEELRALDKVLIEIEGENVAATMGDYELGIDGGPLADFRREESGVKLTASLGRADLLLAGARSAGRFMSVTFRGVDGKQGAYLLTDDSGAAGVSVVAGSERVWVDGQRLTRGRDNDYVIDYSGGAIEFTERRPIVAENEITVDYEFTTGDFQRDSYAGRALLTSPGGAARVGLSFFEEADDTNAAASVSFSEKELAVLAAAGDDPELAQDDGVDSVGVGNGDYVRVSEGVFEYAGPDSGDFDLHFERAQGGDYVYDFFDGHYTFVGEGEGDYRLGRRLPMPTGHSFVALDGSVSLEGGGRVEASAALSDFDANTYSDEDDGDNLGNAQVLSAELPLLDPGGGGGPRLDVSLLARRVAGTFRGIGRFRELGYAERWELEGLELPGGETMLEGAAALRLAGGGRAELSYAWLERGSAVDSRRTEFSVEGRPTDGSRLWCSGRLVDSSLSGEGAPPSRERGVYRGGFEHTLGPVRPGVRYTHDVRIEGEVGERYDEYGASVENSTAGAVTFGASCAYRQTDRTDGNGWTRASTTRTQEYRLGLTRWNALRVSGSVVRRSVEFEEGFEDPAQKYDIASLRVTHTSFGGSVTGEVRYSVTATEVEEKQKFTEFEDGVEITRIVRTGEYLPVTDLTAGTRWTLKPGARGRGGRGRRRMPEPTALGRFLSGLSFTTDMKLRESTTTDDRRGLYLLDPDVLRGMDTVRGEMSGRHVARFLSANSALSVRVAVATRDVLDRSYTNAPSSRRERSGTADVKLTRPGGVTYRVQGDLGTREQDSDGDGDYSVEERSILGEAGFRRLGDLDVKVAASVGKQDETLSGVRVTIVKVTPTVTYRLAGRGALSASLTRTDVAASGGALPERPYLAEGRREGTSTEWRVTGDYRFNRFITGSLSYAGEANPGSEPVHTLDLRVSAFF